MSYSALLISAIIRNKVCVGEHKYFVKCFPCYLLNPQTWNLHKEVSMTKYSLEALVWVFPSILAAICRHHHGRGQTLNITLNTRPVTTSALHARLGRLSHIKAIGVQTSKIIQTP